MRRRTRSTLLLGAFVVATGCADAITLAPEPATRSRGPRFDEVPESWPVRIRSASATLDLISPSGQTTLKSEMRYDGHDASIQAASTIRESSGGVVQRSHPINEDQHTGWGWNEHHWNHQGLIVQSRCGALVEADVQFKAWMTMPNLEAESYHYDEQATGRSATVHQDPCAPCPVGMTSTGSEADGGSDSCAEETDEPQDTGGGGGSSPCPECVEQPVSAVCRVKYWYWKEPFEVYDWIILWCA